jgi:hypothetical protein
MTKDETGVEGDLILIDIKSHSSRRVPPWHPNHVSSFTSEAASHLLAIFNWIRQNIKDKNNNFNDTIEKLSLLCLFICVKSNRCNLLSLSSPQKNIKAKLFDHIIFNIN